MTFITFFDKDDYLIPYLQPIFQTVGEFLLTDRNMQIKPKGKIFSINEGYSKFWDPAMKEYIERKKFPQVNFERSSIHYYRQLLLSSF